MPVHAPASPGLSQIGQIAIAVKDLPRAVTFYRDVLGLPFLFEAPPNLAFFDCAGVRLMLDKAHSPENIPKSSVIYFRCADIALAVRELEARGVTFSSKPHLIAKMDDHDLWMAFFTDPDGHTLALMQEAPKGYKPAG
jgi:methylmalonyl-CoA/ethylmalonyl-CoA epimerase